MKTSTEKKWTDSITTINGIGDKTAQAFAKLGIYTIGELVSTYPRDYLFYGDEIAIADIKEGERVAVCAVINSYVDVRKVRNLTLVNLTARDSSGTIKLTWFNQPYLKHVFHKGESFVFVGSVSRRNGSKVMLSPEYYSPEKYNLLKRELQPVYPLTQGLSNKTYTKAVDKCREMLENLEDYIPCEVLCEYELMPIGEAYLNVHFPGDEEQLKNAIRRLAFDEFYRFLADMSKMRENCLEQENAHVITKGKEVAQFVAKLPFSLTKGQMNAIEDILADMGGSGVMNRLLQGDVGSGKTVVAEAAIFACVNAGYQAALMAPTEVLAKQHYDEMEKLFGGYGIKVGLLVGSMSVRDKRRVYDGASDGSISLVVGTHALIEDAVTYKDLGLVVTDEQHRFGVKQREKLSKKGEYPHTLVMSATPIPRTLAIIMYADMDISVMDELPKGRKPIKNCVVGTGYRDTSHSFIASEVKAGHQAYVICPMVESSEVMDLTNVTEYTDTLKQALGDAINVSMLHGQMKADEKNRIMEDFIAGKIDVLVSTTVIEVGINNPNATVMMVENAERFGLAQLHQLRGRVGRGNAQSYCIFINGKETKESMDRLKVLENSNDGFFIANEDLRLRGPGDFFGIRQSGEAIFKLADIYNHTDVLKKAQLVWQSYGRSLLENGKAADMPWISSNSNDTVL